LDVAIAAGGPRPLSIILQKINSQPRDNPWDNR
jgi:hypothetical protein